MILVRLLFIVLYFIVYARSDNVEHGANCFTQKDLDNRLKTDSNLKKENNKIEQHWDNHRQIDHGHRKNNLGDVRETFKKDKHIDDKLMDDKADKTIENQDPPHHDKRRGLLPEEQLPTIMEIPTIVWVLYSTNDQNNWITYEEITSEMSKINRDYTAVNEDRTQDPNFKNLAANYQIQFKLDRIIRKQTNLQCSSDKSIIGNSGSQAIDHAHFLNVWLCDLNGLAGFAQFPADFHIRSTTDGMVVDFAFWGTTHTGLNWAAQMRRTPTHEIGHWLNVRHVWGDGDCNKDDFVGDTPVSDSKWSWVCPAVGSSSCGSLDMYMNHMSYSTCRNIFSQGQVDRSWDLFEPGGEREALTDYVLNPSDNEFVSAIYFIKSDESLNDSPCDLLDKWINVDLNPEKSVYNYYVYMCISYTSNQFMSPVTDVKWVNPAAGCGAGYDQSSIVLDAKYMGYDIVACIKSELFSQATYANSFVDVNVYRIPVADWSSFPDNKYGFQIDKTVDLGDDSAFVCVGYARMNGPKVHFNVNAYGSGGHYILTNEVYNGKPVYKRLHNTNPADPRVAFYFGHGYGWLIFRYVQPYYFAMCNEDEITDCTSGIQPYDISKTVVFNDYHPDDVPNMNLFDKFSNVTNTFGDNAYLMGLMVTIVVLVLVNIYCIFRYKKSGPSTNKYKTVSMRSDTEVDDV